jgi:hypothetical protein
MAKLLFSLRNVPNEEASEVMELLKAHNLDFYETFAGNWGASTPALWIKNDEDYERASRLLYEYHQQRAISQQERYRDLKEKGLNKSLIGNILQRPFQFITYVAGVAFILYLSVKLLSDFGLSF